MNRHHEWDARLASFLHARAREPFAWGRNDCCLFAADAIAAMTGVDIAASFRGYTTERGALAAVRRVTGTTTVEDALAWVAAAHGMAEVPSPLMAQRGDLLLVFDGRFIAGLLGLHGQPVCVGEAGLHRLPLTAAKRAWRV